MEELEGTVEEIAEAETSILDTLEEGSQKVRTTAENIFVVAKAARDTSLVLAAFGGLGLLLWVLSWKVLGVAPAKVSSPTPTPEEESAPAKTPSTVPTPAKVGILERWSSCSSSPAGQFLCNNQRGGGGGGTLRKME